MWIGQYPALREFSKRRRFFAPMCITMGQRKIDRAPWGLALNVFIGALLGMLDVVTDISSISMFVKEEKMDLAYALGG